MLYTCLLLISSISQFRSSVYVAISKSSNELIVPISLTSSFRSSCLNSLLVCLLWDRARVTTLKLDVLVRLRNLSRKYWGKVSPNAWSANPPPFFLWSNFCPPPHVSFPGETSNDCNVFPYSTSLQNEFPSPCNCFHLPLLAFSFVCMWYILFSKACTHVDQKDRS